MDMDCRRNPTPWPPDTVFEERRGVAYFVIDDREFIRSFEWSVCPTCLGRGRHVSPNIDADHGVAWEEFDEDPDFYEEYMSGAYDVECAECGGRRVVPVLREPCRELDDYRRQIEEHRALCEAERRRGC